jgi:hypothetical protein
MGPRVSRSTARTSDEQRLATLTWARVRVAAECLGNNAAHAPRSVISAKVKLALR